MLRNVEYTTTPLKVGTIVKLNTKWSGMLKRYDGIVTTITDVIYGQHDLEGPKTYRYKLDIDDEETNEIDIDVWHPHYFELIPPTPKHRRIRL